MRAFARRGQADGGYTTAERGRIVGILRSRWKGKKWMEIRNIKRKES